MTHPFQVPGYVQGFRFSDDPDFYDSATKTFIDQSAYGALHTSNNLAITTGTPAFVTDASGQRGMTLNNTVQGEFFPAIPWEGSVILAVRPHISGTGTQTTYPLLFGSASLAPSNGSFQCEFSSGSMRYKWRTPGGGNLSQIDEGDETKLVCLGYATDQNTRKGYRTVDGVTITETAAVASSVHGNALAIGAHSSTVPNGAKTRFGNLSGVIGDTVATALSLTFFEMHFFAGNIWLASPDEAEACMTALRSKYGIT